MRHFICLTGVKQAGKSTFASIAKELDSTVIELAIADKLKNACAKVFDVPRSHFDLSEFKEKDLDQYAYLDTDNISAVIKEFGVTPKFDRDVRPHISMVLENPRRIAQYFGTEILRSIDPQIHCLGTVNGLPEDGIFIVTDMRFPNEYDFFTSQPGSSNTVYVHNARAEAESAKDGHVSEKFIKEIGAKCMWKLENNFSLKTYESDVRALLKVLLRKP